MSKLLNRGISTPIAITIIIVLAVVLVGGALGYQYWWATEEEAGPPEGIPAGQKIYSPKYGDVWKIGKTYEVKWNPAVFGTDTVYLALVDSEGGGVCAIDAVPNTGSYLFAVPKKTGFGSCTGPIFPGDKYYVTLSTKATSAQSQMFSVKGAEDQTADWETYRNEEYGFEIKYPSTLSKLEIPNEGVLIRDYTPSYEDRNIPQRTITTKKTNLPLERCTLQSKESQERESLSLINTAKKINEESFYYYVNYPEYVGAYCGMSTGCHYVDVYRKFHQSACYEIKLERNDVAYRKDNQQVPSIVNQMLSTFRFTD